MATAIIIRNPKYFRHFDDSDNECCWQVDRVGEDIESILLARGIQGDPLYEDWGAGFAWVNTSGITHSLMLECVDVDKAAYKIKADAWRRRWFVLTPAVPDDESDFAWLLPLVRQLDVPAE